MENDVKRLFLKQLAVLAAACLAAPLVSAQAGPR
jgi:hypothetical protein